MPAFVLPDLGEGLTEAEIVSWHVQVGDTVAVDQDVVEVETAKAVVEIPVPFAGRVAELHASPGDLLAVGAPLITVSDDRTLAAGESLCQLGDALLVGEHATGRPDLLSATSDCRQRDGLRPSVCRVLVRRVGGRQQVPAGRVRRVERG